MAFEQNNFSVARKIALEKSSLTVECNIMAGGNVSKILSLSVSASPSCTETLNGVLNYSGEVDCKLIFLGEDNEIYTVCSSCPFSSKFEGENIESGADGIVEVKVVDYSEEILGGENVKVVLNLEQSGFIITNSSVGALTCNDDEVCCKVEEICVVKYIGSVTDNKTVESEINIRENIKKILLTESCAVVKNVESGTDFVAISGEIATRVLYLSENDKFESGYIYDTFKEELALEGATKESFVEGYARVKQCEVVTEIVQDEKGGKIVVKVPISLSVYAFAEDKVSVIKDLYSTKCDISVTTESFSMTIVSPMDTVEGKIEGSLTLEESHPRVDKLLFFGGNSVTVTNCYLKDGEIFVEGIARSSGIYLNDEDSSLHRAELEIPFSISDKYNGDEGIFTASAIVCDVDVIVKKGREFYYDAKVKACINRSNDEIMGIISQASMLEEYPQKDYAMEIIYAPTGANLWDVAKHARVKEEQISMQNPQVVFPTTEDTTLVLFYQKV